MKHCFKCGLGKPLSEFYKHPAMGDGLLGKCKECTKRDARNNYRANHERIRAYDRARNKTPERIAQKVVNQRRVRLLHPDKYRARLAVASAVRAGKLKRLPCCVCGDWNSEAHHVDYSRPLDVQWLCMFHHREAHGALISTATNKAA